MLNNLGRQTVSLQELNKLETCVNQALEFTRDDHADLAVQINRISKSFGKDTIFSGLNMNLRKQQIHGIIGRNGSGKTVMLKCVCGFLATDAGGIRVLNQVVGKDCDFPKNTGVLIESPGFLPNESAYNNLKWLSQLGSNLSKESIYELIELVGLDPMSKKHVGKYSLGMRQRLGIAQALLDDPELLILDEPMNGLDKHGVVDIRKLLISLREKGKTIILSSHFAQDIEELCDSVYEMDQGNLTLIR